MQTILKTFRLPADYVRFLEDSAKEKQISQTEVVLESLQKLMESQDQWQQDLKIMAEDLDYKEEQIALAEEHYE